MLPQDENDEIYVKMAARSCRMTNSEAKDNRERMRTVDLRKNAKYKR